MFLSVAYSIQLFYRVSFGSVSRYISTMPNIIRREFFVLLPLIIVFFILGVYPNIVLDSLHLAVSSLLINTLQNLLSNIKECSYFSCLVPVIIYHNAKTDKKKFFLIILEKQEFSNGLIQKQVKFMQVQHLIYQHDYLNILIFHG